jgi:hypothetical protein
VVTTDAIFQNISQESVHDPITRLGLSIDPNEPAQRTASSDFEVVDIS